MLFTVLLLLGLTACNSDNEQKKDAVPDTAEKKAEPSKPESQNDRAKSRNKYDKKDPNDAGCSSEQLEDDGKVVDVPGTMAELRLSDGRLFATLVMRRSEVCPGAAWGRVTGLPPHTKTGNRLSIVAVRPADNETAPFPVPPSQTYVEAYGDMLAADTDCVFVRARAVSGGKRGSARTPCRTP